MAKLDEIVRTTVTHVIASAIPRTDNTNRSGRRRMFAQANRSRRTNVLFPEAGGAITDGREIVVEEEVSTSKKIFGVHCFGHRIRGCHSSYVSTRAVKSRCLRALLRVVDARPRLCRLEFVGQLEQPAFMPDRAGQHHAHRHTGRRLGQRQRDCGLTGGVLQRRECHPVDQSVDDLLVVRGGGPGARSEAFPRPAWASGSRRRFDRADR